MAYCERIQSECIYTDGFNALVGENVVDVLNENRYEDEESYANLGEMCSSGVKGSGLEENDPRCGSALTMGATLGFAIKMRRLGL